MTERFARERVRHELVRRRLTVLRRSEPAPGFVRVVLGGDDLAGFTAPGPDDHVKAFFPAADGESVARDYTPRAVRAQGAEGPELDLDFFLHDATGGHGGPAARWAAAARPGDQLEIGGPRGSALAPTELDRLILVADETALPAAARWLEAVPGIPATGLFTVEDPAAAAYLAPHSGPGREFRWFSGADRDAALSAVLRELPIAAGDFLFLAGEANALVPLRRRLRRELELPKAQVDVHGYWRRGTAGHDHHAPVDPEDSDD